LVISLIFRDYIQFRGKDIDYGCQRLVNELQSVLDAVRFANAAAALSVTRLGAQPWAPVRADIEKFLGHR